MGISKRTLETLIDLVEIKLSCMEVYDREDARELANLERCLGELDEWVDVGTSGEVHTFTLLFENYDGTPRQEPEIVAFVSFGDGGIVHRLAEVAPEDVTIGMRVEAVFKPKEERQGLPSDIRFFRTVEG